MSPRLKKIILSFALGIFLFGAVTVAQAQLGDPNAGDTFGVGQIGDTVKLSADDPREIAGRIINIALGLLGLITVGLILYGGFLYMTSAGDEEKIATGKKYIINATIGLVIILSAWAIVLFVFKQLNDAIVGDGGSGSGSGDEIDGPECNPEIPGDCDNQCKKYPQLSVCEDKAFYVKSITPGNLVTAEALTTGMNNIAIRVLFSHTLATDTNLAQSVFVQKSGGTDPVPVTVSAIENNKVLEVYYAPNGNPVPFEPNTTYLVTVNKDLKDSAGKALEVNYKSNVGTFPITAHYRADTAFNDTIKPLFNNLNLNGFSGENINFAQGKIVAVEGQLHDRTNSFGGNSLVKITISAASGGSPIYTAYTAPRISQGSSAPFEFSYSFLLDTKFTPGQKYIMTLNGHDIDNNVTTASLSFTIKGNHCDNDVQDGDETGVDSGGSCGGGEGDSCTTNADCANGFQCIDKVCRAVPTIMGIDPLSGAAGNWVTILGKNFTNAKGKVEFGVEGENGNYTWTEAAVVPCGGKSSWTDKWVIVSVPELAVDTKAAIRLTTAAGKVDLSIDNFGPRPGGTGLFTVTNVKKPGLCDVSVLAATKITQNGAEYDLFADDTFAPPGVTLKAIGSGLATAGNGNVITFGATKKADDLVGGVVGEIVDNYWNDTQIRTRVPANMKAGLVPVHAKVNGQVSNGVPFQVLGTGISISVPQISSITPATSTPLSLVTIQGKGFGNTTGQIFIASSANTVKTCDTGTPDVSCRSLKVTDLGSQCGQTWTDAQVIAQLPPPQDKLFVDGGIKIFNIMVKTVGPPVQKTNGQETIVIEPGPPGIGLCRIIPGKGPAPLPVDGAPIAIYGVNVPGPGVIDVIYWKKGAVANPNTNTGIAGWLYNLSHNTPEGDSAVVSGFPNGTGFTTRLPVDENGISMSSGPIRVFDNETGRWSNAVNYTVESCIGSKTPLPGYRCCEAGPEEGQWKKNNLACAGETRAAGYTWRFMTGVLANQPQVVEQCNDVDFPSPTPRVKETSSPNTASCVNASIALRFNMGMDPTTLNNENIKLFACGTGPGNRIDCDEKKTAVESLDITYQNGANTLMIREAPPKNNLEANTWYQVELSEKITALEHATVLGVNQQIKTPLLPSRSCGKGTAYCFTFKTNASECTLAGAGINPRTYTTKNLGVIQDPRYPFDSSKVFIPPSIPSNPLYYFLWGKGNQECSVISSQLVDKYSWNWSPLEGQSGSDRATALKSPVAEAPGIKGYNNIRAVVTARSHTAPDFAVIKAEALVETSNNLNSTDIGGANVLQAANISVGQTGFAPTAPVTLPEAASSQLSLQNTFALQMKFAQPEKSTFPNNVLIQKINLAVAGKPSGYVIKFINNQVCLNPYNGSGSTVNLCSTITADSNGQYNVVLVGDKSKNKLFWVDLVPPTRPVLDIPLAAIPNSGNALAILAAEKNPLNAKGPIYFALQVSGSVPSFLTANSSIILAPTSTLFVDLADPAVTYYEPNCIESCNNASIRVDFNRQMVTSTYAAGFQVFKCMDGVTCANTQPAAVNGQSIYTIDVENSTQLTLRAHLSAAGPNLDPNQYYKVSLNGNNLAIKSIARVNPLIYGKPLPPTQWVFKTRADAKPCSVGFLQVSPLDLVASVVGQQDKYTVVPYSAPNACSKVGQALNKWAYQYSWSTENSQVATISKLPAAQYSNVSASCTLACLKKGSTIASDSTAKNNPICGNGGVPESGEDCDIASANEVPGTSCALNCVRPGNLDAYRPEKTGDGVCGNDKVESNKGEQCDPGNFQGSVSTTHQFCTSTCLLRGSKPTTTNVPGVAVCGDGEITPGQETCDIADPNSQNGCSAQCVRKGTPTAAFWCMANNGFATDQSCKASVSVCGNGKVEPSEDCEVGVKVGNDTVTSAMCNKSCQFIDACGLANPPCAKNSPGCSDKCTLLGSKSTYSTPSVCGDRLVGTGENPACELNPTTLANAIEKIGPTQIVQAVGKANPVPGTSYQQTKVTATTKDSSKEIIGSADYKLQCGYKEYDFAQDAVYNNCPGNADNNLGVGGNSCCVPRPRALSQYPKDGAGFAVTGEPSVCRNTKIEVLFDREMRPESLNQNVFLVTGHTTANFDCSTVQGQNFTDTVSKIIAATPVENKGFWAQIWERVTDWTRSLFVTNATATSISGAAEFKAVKTWCSGEVPVSVNTQNETIANANNPGTTIINTRASLSIGKTLDPDTVYGVILRGDLGGIVDVSGVPMKAISGAARNDAWFFKTSASICKIKEVGVAPAGHVFNAPQTSQTFSAFATSTNGQLIQSTPGYAWTWTWAPNPNTVFDFTQVDSVKPEILTVTAKNVPGKITGVAMAKITADSSTQNNQLGQTFNETFELEALFCKRPWPANPGYPFKDAVYNFETGYCADAGAPTNDGDDLPYLREQSLESGPISSDSLKKMVFFNDKNSDVIGIQIFASDKPLAEWFAETQKFGSSASFRSEVVGEYGALTDGNNYYIQALNYESGASSSDSQVKSYVYLFSINPNADGKTREVFNKLLQRLTFNTNLSNHNYCLIAGGNIRTNPNAINANQCSTDFDCRDAEGSPKADSKGVMSIGTCSNVRTKFLRDWKRLNDLRTAQDNIDAFFATQGNNPDFKGTFAGGSFVPGYTVSKWGESWGRLQEMTKGSFSDPLNRWTTCNADDPQTCWSASSTTYFCPKFKSVYEYEYIKNGNTYKLHAPLEFFRTTDQITKDYVDVARFTTAPWAGCATGSYNPFQEKCGDGVLNQAEQCDPPGIVELTDVDVQTTFDQCSQWAESKACLVNKDCGVLLQTQGRYINGIFNIKNGAKGVCVGRNGSALTIARNSNPQTREYEMLSCSDNTECDAFVSSAKSAPGNFNNTHGLLSFHPTADKNSYFPVAPQYQVLNGAPLQQFLADSNNKLTCDTTSFKTTNKYHLVDGGSFCTFNAFNPIIKSNPTLNAKGEYELFACSKNSDCQSINGSYRQTNGSVLYGVGGILRTNTELDTDLKQNINSLFTCQPVNTVLVDDSLLRFQAGVSSCSVPTVIPQACGEGELVKRTCNSQCTWQYGSCASAGSCGNGKVEGAEVCDDGALNDTYGHCNAICTGLAAARCGNGQKDFVDQAKKTLEFCEAGIDGFTAKYNLDRNKSCSWDCRNYGGFCGDGFVQAESGETCDDGNRIDDAQCLSNCKLPSANAFSCLKALVAENQVATGSGSTTLNLYSPPSLPKCGQDLIQCTQSCNTQFPGKNEYGSGHEAGWAPCINSCDTAHAACIEPENGTYYGGELCKTVIPRDLCAAANLSCSNVRLVKANGFAGIQCQNYTDPGSQDTVDELNEGFTNGQATSIKIKCIGDANLSSIGQNSTNPQCGNGTVEKIYGEECDAGVNNDKKCVPGPNQDSCSYCGNGCKVLTVDQEAFCGNGVIDDSKNEQCDFTTTGQIIMKQNGSTVPALCSDQGTYSCNSNCTVLAPQCVACGPSAQGVVPVINILNPIQKLWSERPKGSDWPGTNDFYFYRKQGTNSYALIGGNNLASPTITAPQIGFKSLADATKALQVEQDKMCIGRYSMLFNPSKVLENNNNSYMTIAPTAKINGTLFPFTVNAQAANAPVVQELITSPSVPPDTFRIVLKWTDQDKTAEFNGALFNEDFNKFDTAIWSKGIQEYRIYAMKGWWNNNNQTALCSSMGRAGTFWTPIQSPSQGETCESNYGIMVSPNQTSVSGKTFIQTFTLNTADYLQSGKAFTFFVNSLTDTTMGSLKNSSLEVFVYTNKPLPKNGINASDISLYSVYEPDYVFKIKDGTLPSGSSASAYNYWQVFNIVKENGKYIIKKIEGKEANGSSNGQFYQNGLFHKCSTGLFSYMPGKVPVTCP